MVSKIENIDRKVPKQAEAKRDGVKKPTKLQFQSILIRKILMLSKRYESTEVDRRTWLHVPSGTHLCITRNHSPCLLRWSCLQTSEGQRRSEFHLVGIENSETPATSSVWPSDHREDYRSCAWPFYSLVQIIPKATGLGWTSSEATLGSWSPSPLIVSRESFSLWTWAGIQTALNTVYFNGRH